MKTRTSLFVHVLAAVLSLSIAGGAASLQAKPQDQTAQPAPDSVRLRPFQPTRITQAFSQSNTLITESGKKQIPEEVLKSYSEEVDTLHSVINGFLDDSTVITLEGVSIRELDYIGQRTDFYIQELGKFQDRLARESSSLGRVIGSLSDNRQRWVLTRESTPEEELIETRVLRIERTVRQLDSVRALLQEDQAFLMEQQDRILDKRNELNQLMTRVREKRTELGEQLFSREMPGFFSDLSNLRDSTLIREHARQLKQSVHTDYEILKTDYGPHMIVISLLLIIFLAYAIWYKRHFAKMMSVERFELSDMHMALIYSPAVTVVFIIAILIRFILPDLPRTFNALNLVIMMVPMMIIVINLFGSQIRAWILVLVIVYSLTFLYELAYSPDIWLRIILLLFSFSGLWLFLWIIVKKPLLTRFDKSLIYRIFRLILLFFTVLLFLSVIANLLGAFALAEFMTLVPLQIAVLAIGIQVAIRVADTVVFLILASNYLQRVNVIRDEFRVIHRKTVWLIDLFLWLFFLTTALRIFRVKDAVFEWGRGILTNGFNIGEVTISLGNILIFIFVIWLSIVIARILRHVLEKDVFARVEMAKGVPSTIIMLLRIALITGGFFLAAAAAGMELTNLSIVLGAFSVGIGFGLQNIFNNMVSGLILAFERPIKVGDVVQVGELLGVVLKIGLRSSTVKSFDGAEVIVPNGNLISDQMINWTLSDSNRRMDIRIGVAYGTDPERVLSIMKEVAQEHKHVWKDPHPWAYFLGFGESSLDFRLLAWTDINHRLETESELYVSLNRKIVEAGIEIPFPQRDLHIRSDHTKGQAKGRTKPPAEAPEKAPGKRQPGKSEDGTHGESDAES